MKSTKDFWKHTENGRIYAIESSPFGKILSACGPFDPYNLPDLEVCEFGSDILIWVEMTMTEGKLRRFNPEPVKPEPGVVR